MRKGLIYKYTNKIDGLNYIGQTSTTLKRRDEKHLNQLNDNTYFHRALKKYGRENFDLVILEDNIPLDKIDEREIFWIKQFESYYKTGKGYNMTKGGKWGNSSQKIIHDEEIKDLILNTDLTFQEIADLFNVSLSCISDINTGRTFFDNSLVYPLRDTYKRPIITENTVNEIINLLTNTDLSYEQIAAQLNVKSYTVGNINRGNSTKCPSNLTYPIRKGIKENTYQNILTQEKVINIIYDLLFTNLTQIDIGKKYGVAKNTIGDISRGISWKEITNQFKCPIKRNKKENQTIYTSIYGIV